MMRRDWMILSAAWLAIGLGSMVSASAQEFVFPGAVIDGPIGDGIVPGGFGTNYTQPPPVSGIPGNRWNMLAGPSYVEGIPYASGTLYNDPFAVNPIEPIAPQGRVRGRRNGRALNGPPPFLAPLPTSRLYGEGGLMPAQYAPFTRRQTYGSAYGMGPYGSNYYSNFWHGEPIYP